MPVDERMLDADAPKLFFDDVIRFLKGVKAMSACASCSAQSWEIPVGSFEHSEVVLTQSGMTQESVMLMCNNCGMQRAHSARFIGNWLLKDAETSANE
ncbi:hypothetical protein [Pseudomonas syringae]|uniref:hypothetical protein n=1 Tax=Pseudomonas syringae TaxID=317 RepID=UPI0003FDC100|nr:hypothetical protein [Pseudomonas syringae]